jgi:hypothetical protein
MGIPKKFRPRIQLGWSSRGDNMSGERRQELRRVAQTQIEAMVKQAKVDLEQEEVRQLRQLTAHGLESPQALAFLGEMPHAEDLLPPVVMLQLANGERVPLPGVTPERNGVTAEGNDKARERNACATCGKALAPGHGKYCSGRCRQSAYRQRQAAALPDPKTASRELSAPNTGERASHAEGDLRPS